MGVNEDEERICCAYSFLTTLHALQMTHALVDTLTHTPCTQSHTQMTSMADRFLRERADDVVDIQKVCVSGVGAGSRGVCVVQNLLF